MFQSSEHVKLREGAVSIGNLSRIIFQDNFTDANWRLCYNKEDAIIFVRGERTGRRGLIISKSNNMPFNCDTAFELRSRAFAVEPDVDFRMTITTCGNWKLYNTKPASLAPGDIYEPDVENDESHGFFNGEKLPKKYKYDGNVEHSPLACRCGLRWLDAKGVEIAFEPFRTIELPEMMQQNIISGVVPKKAVYAQILVGADSPNFNENTFTMLLKAYFETRDGRPFPTATFVSSPFPMQEEGAPITWKADTPGSTQISLQLSSCADINSGEWTPFVGASLDPQRAFTKSGAQLPAFPEGHKWLRYKITMRGDNKNSPVLKSVSVGEHTESNWSGEDILPPVIVMETAARQENAKAPITFSFEDNTGVEWRSIAIKIDDKDVSADFKRKGNCFTYTPRIPFKPLQRDFSRLEDWEYENRNMMLDKKILTDRAVRISRDGGEADTYFKLTSPMFGVSTLEMYSFSCQVRSSIPLQKSNASHGQIIFLNAGKQPIGTPETFRFKQSDEWTDVKCDAVAPNGAVSAVIHIQVEDDIYGGNFVEMRNASIKGKISPINSKEPNMHLVTVRASDITGNTATRSFGILYSPNTHRAAQINEDGSFLRNARLFTPIALANMWVGQDADNEAFRDLKRNGFNASLPFAGMDVDEQLAYLEGSAANNVAAILDLPEGEPGEILRKIALAQENNAIFGWMLDEQAIGTRNLREVQELATSIHSIAPWQVIVLKGKINERFFSEFASAVDVLMPIIDDDEDIPSIMAQTAALECKVILPMMRIRRNNSTELLSRSCAAFLCGAKGIVFDCEIPDARESTFIVANHLQNLNNALSGKDNGEVQYKVLAGYDKPVIISHNTNGARYIVFLNPGDKSTRVKFTVKDCDEAKLLLEDSTLRIGGTTFEDGLPAKAVRIYELRNLFE